MGDGLLSTLCQYGAIGNVLDDLMVSFVGLLLSCVKLLLGFCCAKRISGNVHFPCLMSSPMFLPQVLLFCHNQVS